MKKYLVLITLFTFNSCAIKNYYQVHKVKPENGGKIEGKLIFEDKFCKVSYDFWDENGDVGFFIYNKFSDEIVVDMSRTFFVTNGMAYPYYNLRKFSKESSSTRSIRELRRNSWEFSTEEDSHETEKYMESYEEARFIVVPPKTTIRVSEYQVVGGLFKNCSLPKSGKTSMTINFSRNESPFVFYNRIAYSTKNKDSIIFENKFYVEAISNIPESDMFNNLDTNKCGKKYVVPMRVLKNYGPDYFYIPYSIE